MRPVTNWIPAIAGMVCLGFGPALMGIYGFFVQPLSNEFGVGAAIINIGPVALLIVPAFVAPFVGRLADRVVIRHLILFGASLAMLSLFAISRASNLWLAGLGFVFFAIGLTGYGPVVINGLMVKIYPGKEAKALALAAAGISFASALLPPVVGLLLAAFDWRQALAILAASLLVIIWCVVLAAMPKGVATAQESASKVAENDPGEAKGFYRRKEFWLVGICVALAFNMSLVLAVCYPAHFASQGYTVAEAGWFLSLAGLFGLLGKTGVGFLGDSLRAHAKWMVILLLAFQAVGIAILLGADSKPIVFLGVAFLGFGGGGFLPIHPYLNSCYFEAGIIAQVNGAQMPLFLPLGLVGAPLAGYVFDKTGNYETVFVALACIFILSALVALSLPKPQRVAS